MVIYSVICGVTLRWGGLSRDSLWFDEIVTLQLTQYRWSDLFAGILVRDSHPPLFLLIAKPWASIFGISELGIRSLSALIGTLSLAAMFFMGKVFGGLRSAFFGVTILAFHHFAVWYSEEFRSYILLFTLTTLSLTLCARILLQKQARTADYILLSVVNLLSLLTHYYALLLILFENFTFLYVVLFDGAKPDVRWWKAQAVSFCVNALWLPGLCFHAFHLSQSHLLGQIDLPTLVHKLCPIATRHFLDEQLLFLQALPYICVVLFGVTLSPKLWRGKQGESATPVFVRPDEKLQSTKPSLFLFLLLAYLMGCAFLLISYFPFNTLNDTLPPWNQLAFEGLALHSITFALIGLGDWVSRSKIVGGFLKISVPGSQIIPMLLGVFPLFVVIAVEITCHVFRPNYLMRNMIIILPSFIVAMATVLGQIKSAKLSILLLAAIFLTLFTQMKTIPQFSTRFDFRKIANGIEQISHQYARKPSLVVLSSEGKLSMEHYLSGKDFKTIYCDEACDKKLEGADVTAWIWHKIPLPSELNGLDIFEQKSKQAKRAFQTESAGVIAVLLDHSAEKTKTLKR